MGSYIRLRKTAKKYRNTYKLKDEHGEVICELHPGKDGITETDIRNCHKVDDMEVYENNRSFSPRYPDWLQKDIDEWRQRKIDRFIADFGREPNRDELPKYEHLVSLDTILDQENGGDNCSILAEELLRQRVSESIEVEMLRELVATFPSSWQEIYWLVLIVGMPVAQVARTCGVTDMAIHKTVKKIRKLIAEDEKLKNFFQGV